MIRKSAWVVAEAYQKFSNGIMLILSANQKSINTLSSGYHKDPASKKGSNTKGH
jgi:hypothetical protein